MFLTLSQFLSYFPDICVTKEEFVRKFVVTYSGNPTLEDLFNLKSVIKNVEDSRYINREAIIEYFYDILVVNREKYLTEFYQSYFSLPDFFDLKWDNVDILRPYEIGKEMLCMDETWLEYIEDVEKNQLKMLERFNKLINQRLPSLSLQKNDGSRKIVRNLNYLDILHNTEVTNTCKCKTSFWQTLINVYNKFELEDRFFAPSSIGLFLRKKKSDMNGINYNNFFYLFQQYQPKASILNPYTINWILKNKFAGKKLLTPVLSWVSYLIAFMHSNWEHYVGVDVMPTVCEKAQFLFDHYKKEILPKLTCNQKIRQIESKKLDIYCQPSESLLYDKNFIDKYDNYFDAIILCPPYFDMEIYPEGDQSTHMYPNYDQWLKRYWEDTVAMCHLVLNKGGRFAFIINNYVSLKKEEYLLIQDLNLIALKYFRLAEVYDLANRVSPLRMNSKKRTEMLFIYEK